ncbi:MAG TPA: serine/threonine-protein kinase [Frankiaceae bacterium]|nr:serine/threonine-protein kinase [Frankiaceae bacterium]
MTVHQSGEVVAGFRIDRLIGSGGMGEVYLVHHPRLPRLDALKLLPMSASSDHSYRERFQREADLAASLDHDNVVPVYDRGEADGQLWIHMKYVAGQDAAAALRTGGPFSTARALHLVTRVASALDDAHRHGLLHRDVKPANILLGTPADPGGPDRVYLTDFGIAKGAGDAAGLTPSGHFAASLDYAAPEQIQMQPLDGRADQYALGCVLFQLLTGVVPFPGDGAWARMNAHLSAPIPRLGQLRPGLPLGVQAVLDRAMAKDPKDRFPSCAAMASELTSALAVSPAPRGAALPAPRPPDLAETPPPGFASPTPVPPMPPPMLPPVPPPMPSPDAPTAAEPPVPVPLNPPAQWWRHVDRAAGATGAAALVLGLLSLFPPTSAQSGSRFAGEIATGHFAAGQLPTLLLLAAAVGLHLTRDGHRYRPLLYAVVAGAGFFALADSLRVYAFTQANPGGAYDTALSRSNGSLPRAAVALAVVLIAMAGVLRTAPRPKPRAGPHLLAATLLAVVAVILTAVAVIVGPAIQVSRLHEMLYGVPLAPSVVAAVLLAAGAVSRRLPVLVTSVTVSACAFIAGAAAPDPLHYPLAMVADCLLIAAAVVLLLASRRPADIDLPPRPPEPPRPEQRPPFGWPPHITSNSPLRRVVTSLRGSERRTRTTTGGR